MVTISELQVKEIISVENGQKLGHLIDLEIDVDRGRITAIVLGNKGKMMGLFGKEEEVVIPWESILTIGDDVILVKHGQKPQLYPPKKEE
ncbi:YlmC/YmxH family sporulation protein [Pontibacillus yanchengensis]|uniref:YlmC/YmxH family sporulation protein n=2 Tax=Pontibacillus yanchengensis TaxID=462910 RepID=A0ACC7VD73_9BACI|nr:YlmC/YmxH family sporulation protein [Pontibacillus yanchengensis]MYL33059.1 YlmC/YmxH family sporulation protein [Pontibacillus yanchengensis]MYL52090.1 YlmC/YmxH family sporulation protein [Pontibacillus yanchengensis]